MPPEVKYLFFHRFNQHRLDLDPDHVNLFSVVIGIVTYVV